MLRVSAWVDITKPIRPVFGFFRDGLPLAVRTTLRNDRAPALREEVLVEDPYGNVCLARVYELKVVDDDTVQVMAKLDREAPVPTEGDA